MASVIELRCAPPQGVRLSGRRWVAPETDPALAARCAELRTHNRDLRLVSPAAGGGFEPPTFGL